MKTKMRWAKNNEVIKKMRWANEIKRGGQMK